MRSKNDITSKMPNNVDTVASGTATMLTWRRTNPTRVGRLAIIRPSSRLFGGLQDGTTPSLTIDGSLQDQLFLRPVLGRRPHCARERHVRSREPVQGNPEQVPGIVHGLHEREA